MSELQQAIVLHSRPYQNSSLLVDFFGEKEGVFRCVAKGFKRKSSVSLSPFRIFDISFTGRSDLKTLTQCELAQASFHLQKQALYCGLYVNELLLRVLYPHDAHAPLFFQTCRLYEQLNLADELHSMENHLRMFEFTLLREIGYLVDMRHEYDSGVLIDEKTAYVFNHESGFSRYIDGSPQQVFSGVTLLELNKMLEQQTPMQGDEQFRRESKMLSRLMLAPYLGNKPLQSRALFKKFEVKI